MALDKFNGDVAQYTEILWSARDFFQNKPEYEGIANNINKLADYYKLTRDVFLTSIDASAYEGYEKAFLDLKMQIYEYFNTHKPSGMSKSETQVYNVLSNVNNILNSETNMIMENALGRREEYIKKIKSGEFDKDVQTYKENIGLEGTKPSIDDCLNLSINNPDIQTTMKHFTWLLANDYKLSRVHENVHSNDETFYKQTLTRFTNEMKSAPLDVQYQFGYMLAVQQEAVRSFALDKYNDSLTADVEDPEDYAHQVLYTSREYAMVNALDYFSPGLLDSNLTAVKYALNTFGPGDLSKTPRETSFIANLTNGGMNKFFRDKLGVSITKNDTKAYEVELFSKDIDQSGFMPDADLDSLTSDYNALRNADGSSRFTNMRDTLKAFMNQDHAKAADTKGYLDKLQEAKAMAEAYANANKGFKFTQSGKDRAALANRIVEKLGRLEEKFKANVRKEIDRDAIEEYTDDINKNDTQAIENCAVNAYKHGMSKAEFVNSMMSHQRNTEKSFAEILNPGDEISLDDGDKKYLMDDYFKEGRKEISKKAQESLFSAGYELSNMQDTLDYGVKFGYFGADDVKDLQASRDLKQLIFDAGSDTNTRMNNLETAKIFIGKGLSEDARNKNIADFLDKRLKTLSERDYSKYENMNDAELAENYEAFQKDCFWTTVAKNVITDLAKTNPHISQETINGYANMYNKYSGLVSYYNERMTLVSNPEYANIDVDKIMELNSADLQELAISPDNEDCGTLRFGKALVGTANSKFNSFANSIKAKMFENDPLSPEFDNVIFYNEVGEKLEADQLGQIKNDDVVFALNPADPTNLKCFSRNGSAGMCQEQDANEYFASSSRIINEYFKEHPLEEPTEEAEVGMFQNPDTPDARFMQAQAKLRESENPQECMYNCARMMTAYTLSVVAEKTRAGFADDPKQAEEIIANICSDATFNDSCEKLLNSEDFKNFMRTGADLSLFSDAKSISDLAPVYQSMLGNMQKTKVKDDLNKEIVMDVEEIEERSVDDEAYNFSFS